MGFTDLMSSSRGPGLIGTLLALVVLGGFITLYVFVFDPSLQGNGTTLQSQIQKNQDQIDIVRGRLSQTKSDLERAEDRAIVSDQADKQRATNSILAKRIPDTQAARDQAAAGLAAATKALADYKNSYRASERASAAGEERPELKLQNGTVYTGVKIRMVDSVGMQISHKDGLTRVPFRLLPEADQLRFQFDAEQEQSASTVESASAGSLDLSVQVAQGQEGISQRRKQISDLNAKSVANRARVQGIRSTEGQARMDIMNYQSQIAIERGKPVSHAPAMMVELKSKQDRLDSALRSIPGLEQEANANDEKVRQLEAQIETINQDIAAKAKQKTVVEKNLTPAGK